MTRHLEGPAGRAGERAPLRHPRRRSALGRAAAAVATAALLVGCGGGGGEPPLAQPTASSPTDGRLEPGSGASARATALPSDLPTFTLPLAAYQLSGADLYTLQQAESQLTDECMKRFGFAPQASRLDRDLMVAEQKEADARLYGITSLAQAEANGYLPQLLPDDGQDEAPAEEDRASASYLFVLYGSRTGLITTPPAGGWRSPGRFGGLEIPPAGCLGEARTALWGDPSAQVKDGLAQSLRVTAYERSVADPRVRTLFEQWSRCMARQGYRYRTPLEPRFDREDDTAPSAEERATAVADVRCKDESDLAAKWNRVDVAYQRQEIEDNQLALTAEKDRIRAALGRATEMLHGAG